MSLWTIPLHGCKMPLRTYPKPAAYIQNQSTTQPAVDTTFDFGSYFMIPMNWPTGLPSPFLLDHLLETFFNSVPHFPRMLHKASILTRVRLPPTALNFPHPSLLHAMCAMAAPYTAWVHSIPPEQIEETLEKANISGSLQSGLQDSGDFALTQAELAANSVKTSAYNCMMGPGNTMFEIAQATVSLVYQPRSYQS